MTALETARQANTELAAEIAALRTTLSQARDILTQVTEIHARHSLALASVVEAGVVTPPPPPPIEEPPQQGSLPYGVRLVTDALWHPTMPNGWSLAYGRGLVTTTPEGQRHLLPVGHPAGEGVGTVWRPINTRRVYGAIRVKVSNPFQFHSSGVQKFAYVQTDGNGSCFLGLYGKELVVFPQFSTSKDRWLRTGKTFVLGTWYDVAWDLDADARTVKVWLNGLQVLNATGEPFPDGNFTEYQIVCVWGGTGGAVLAESSITFARTAVAVK